MYSKHANLVVKISVWEDVYQFLITFSFIVIKTVLSVKAATRDGQHLLKKLRGMWDVLDLTELDTSGQI